MVKRGTAWGKNNRRELRRTMGRFLAIFSIVALGVGLFVGLKICRPAMVRIGDEFLEETRFYDYQLLSTIGMTQEDAAYFAAMDGVAAAEGSVTADLLTEWHDGQVVFKTHQLLNTLNQVQLTGGRMPQAPNECLADDLFFTEADLGTVFPVNNELEEDEEAVFSQESYTVVGICNAPQYLNIQRGTTPLGSGSVAAFLYLPAEAYDADYYTELYLELDCGEAAFSTAYRDAMDKWEQPLTDALELRGSLRQEELVSDAEEELADARIEYEDGLQEYKDKKAEVEQELADAERELADAAIEIADARQELEDGERELAELMEDPYSNEELAEARQEIDDGWAELEEGEAEYADGLAEFEKAKAEAEPELEQAKADLAAGEAQLGEGQAELDDGWAELNAGKQTAEAELAAGRSQLAELEARAGEAEQAAAALQQQMQDPNTDPALLPALQQQYAQAAGMAAGLRGAYENGMAEYQKQEAAIQKQFADAEQELRKGENALNEGLQELKKGRQEYEDALQELADAEQELADAAVELADARKTLEDAELELEEAIADAIAEAREKLDDGWAELADGEAEYADGLREYEDGKAEAAREFADAERELEDAAELLEDAEHQISLLREPSYFVLDRMSNNGYASFDNDTSIVEGIAKIFPVFFFLVAALICSSTMTRMVEEQRTQNGTLKALGYSDGRIMWRYASYAGGAATLGSIFGCVIGLWIFPVVIWHAYKMLYHFGEMKVLLRWDLIGVSLLCALVCSVGAACSAAWSEMQQMPAQLMRPKAPKAGKRIWLEYITPLWKRMGFLHKVAARNIFRYKKRMFMMILGVGGCMALLVTGLGLRDSIAHVADDQFNHIIRYDYTIAFDEDQDEVEQAAFRRELGEQMAECAFASVSTVDVLTDRGVKNASVVATADPSISNLVGFHREGVEMAYPTGKEIYVSNKLAEMAGVEIGDTLLLQMEDNERIELPVNGIFDNYVNHYIYMTEEAYEHWFHRTVRYKTAYAAAGIEDIYAVSASMQNMDGVVNVTMSQSFRDMVSDTVSSLDAVIVLIVGCAVALSLVVCYNLCNINITERVREIATIKVLGFYSSETYSYVLRESMVLSVFGMVVGVPLGIWLHRFVMAQVNVDMVSFHVRISGISFVLAVVITLAISLAVNFALHGKIRRINMAESLKAVE